MFFGPIHLVHEEMENGQEKVLLDYIQGNRERERDRNSQSLRN